MSLAVVESGTSIGDNGATIVLQSNSFEELSTLQAKNMAIKTANDLGVPVRGLSGSSGPYMVNKAGKSLKKLGAEVSVEDVMKMAEDNKNPRFQNDFYVVSQTIIP